MFVDWPRLAMLPNRVYKRFLSDTALRRRHYRKANGFYPNLDDPKDFSEKITWLIINGYQPLQTRCTDKILVRDYVEEKIGAEYLIPIIMTTKNPADITPENITQEQFVVKTNHDSGSAVMCMDRENFDWEQTRQKLKTRLKGNYFNSQRERQYKDIKPALIAEELLLGSDGLSARDVKIFCFNGRPRFCQINSGRGEGNLRVSYHNLDWEVIPMRIHSPPPETPHQRPKDLDMMLRHAEILSAPFKFCRVDLYETPEGVFFGELTFTPNCGIRRYSPPELERQLGDWLSLDDE